MQTIKVRTTQNVFIDHQLASIGDRIVAFLIDRIILVFYSVAVVLVFIELRYESFWPYLIFILMPWAFYSLVFEIFMNGQSPGKRAIKIQVVRMNGTEATVGDYFLRWIFSLLEQGVIAVVIIAANGKGQRLGDIVAGTCVVKLTPEEQITANEIFITPENNYSPTFPQVVQLEQKHIELIQRALDAEREFDNDQPSLLAAQKIKEVLGLNTDLPALEFLHTIVKDFNHLNSN